MQLFIPVKLCITANTKFVIMCALARDQISHRACFPEHCAVVACEGDLIAKWCRFGRVPRL